MFVINELVTGCCSLRPLQTPNVKALFLQGFFVSGFWRCRRNVENIVARISVALSQRCVINDKPAGRLMIAAVDVVHLLNTL